MKGGARCFNSERERYATCERDRTQGTQNSVSFSICDLYPYSLKAYAWSRYTMFMIVRKFDHITFECRAVRTARCSSS